MNWSAGTSGRFTDVPVYRARRVGARGVRLGRNRRTGKSARQSLANSQTITPPNTPSTNREAWSTIMQMGTNLISTLRTMNETPSLANHAIQANLENAANARISRASVPLPRAATAPASSSGGTSLAHAHEKTLAPSQVDAFRYKAVQMKRRVDAAKEQVRQTTPGIDEHELNVHPAVRRAREWVNMASKVSMLRENESAY
jgi:hypothetical protein